jgi:hypothetical protein
VTPERLKELRAAGEAATKAPWDYVMHEDWWEVVAPGEPSYICADPNGRAGSCDDAAFIALARNRWGELLDEIERLQAVLLRYGNHDDHYQGRDGACPRYSSDSSGDPSDPCTCGFSAALDEVSK